MLETIMCFLSRQLVLPSNDGPRNLSFPIYASLSHCPLNKQKVNSYFAIWDRCIKKLNINVIKYKLVKLDTIPSGV